VLHGIHELAPNAIVFVVGYPDLLPDDGAGCYPYVPILDEDVPYLVSINRKLNDMLRDVAAEGDAGYVDWYTPSIGHDACQVRTVAWVNGAVLAPPSYPGHPNVYGMRGAARAAYSTIRGTGFGF